MGTQLAQQASKGSSTDTSAHHQRLRVHDVVPCSRTIRIAAGHSALNSRPVHLGSI